jgi:hypothetical protein
LRAADIAQVTTACLQGFNGCNAAGLGLIIGMDL